MNYVSNLGLPPELPNFTNLWSRPMGHSFSHDVPSDWSDKADHDPVFGIFKRCGCWTSDERAILYTVAKQLPGPWCDIGCHTGVTSATIQVGCGDDVYCVDYMLGHDEFLARFRNNTGWEAEFVEFPMKSEEFWEWRTNRYMLFSGVCIDGDHNPPTPLTDAQSAHECATPTAAIIFHDAIGEPVRDGVRWLMDHGWQARIYWTPHVVALCWRGDFTPPYHEADHGILGQRLQDRMTDFADYFPRCK